MTRTLLALGLLSLPLLGAAPARAAAGRYYVVVRDVQEAPGVKSDILPEARKLFVEALRARPELTLDPPPGLPTDPAEMAEELKKRHLKAFELSLRILSVTRSTNPPPPGKKFRVLMRGIRVSVFGSTLPDKIVALGGEGESQIGTEIARDEEIQTEGKKILVDATKEALTQAVGLTVTKLDLAGKPTPKLGGHKRKKK